MNNFLKFLIETNKLNFSKNKFILHTKDEAFMPKNKKSFELFMSQNFVTEIEMWEK